MATGFDFGVTTSPENCVLFQESAQSTLQFHISPGVLNFWKQEEVPCRVEVKQESGDLRYERDSEGFNMFEFYNETREKIASLEATVQAQQELIDRLLYAPGGPMYQEAESDFERLQAEVEE